MTERFELRYVRGHVEVFDATGHFYFSADTMSEAQSELQSMDAAWREKGRGFPRPFSSAYQKTSPKARFFDRLMGG